MDNNTITFGSMTNAMKARDLLKKNSINSRMIRTPAKLRKGSCGYSLVIPKRLDTALELIDKNNIPYRGVYTDDKS